MAAVLQVAAKSATMSISASQTQYFMAAETFLQSSTIEDRGKTIYRTAGTFSNLYIRVVTNDRTGAGTFRLHKNKTTNSTESVSITASTTGEFTDASNTDAVTAGDTWAFQIVGGSGGTVFTFGVASVEFAANSGTVKHFCAGNGTTFATGATRYLELTGNCSTLSSTVGPVQYKTKTSGTIQNMYINVTANSANQAYTVTDQIGGTNGAMTMSVTAGVTGYFEDTTHTDSIVSGNLINYALTSTSGTGSIDFYGIGFDIAYTGNYEMSVSSLTATIATSQTQYFPMGGGTVAGYTTEADLNTKAQIAVTASLLHLDVPTNGISATSTLTSRVGSAAGGQSVSITASTTGFYEDASGTDSLTATSEVDYQIVTGGTGTTLKINAIGMLMTLPSQGGGAPMNWPVLSGNNFRSPSSF